MTDQKYFDDFNLGNGEIAGDFVDVYLKLGQ